MHARVSPHACNSTINLFNRFVGALEDDGDDDDGDADGHDDDDGNNHAPEQVISHRPQEEPSGEFIDDQCGECEGARAKVYPLPHEPTMQERLQHEATHLPFRSWCRHCMQGKARALPHASADHSEDTVPTLGFDFAFLRTSSDGISFSRRESDESESKERDESRERDEGERETRNETVRQSPVRM